MDAEARARRSGGAGLAALHRLVGRVLEGAPGGVCVDVGCGSGGLSRIASARFGRYVGVDAVRYEAFPQGAEFVSCDLNGAIPLQDAFADAVVATEVIEHLENPWAFLRELARLARPGGLVIVTTPNQWSWVALGALVLKGRFSQFRDDPTHLTALLPGDLVRIAGEAGLGSARLEFSGEGRVPLTARHWPAALSQAFPRRLSDNVMLAARKLPS